jgi:DNA-binding transcriptional regulator LsrR (DeoR family)
VPSAPANGEFTDRDRLACTVAYLTSLDKKQEEIRGLLNIKSQSDVSRLLQHAKMRHWVYQEVRWEKIPLTEKHKIIELAFPEKTNLENKLIERSRKGPVQLKSVHVVYTGIDQEPGEHEENFRRFGRAAAQYVVDQIAHAKTCAVAWGRTVQSIVDAISSMNNLVHKPDLMFVPISGEPLNHPNRLSPSMAAQRLSEAFHCKHLSLRGVPARIPRKLSSASEVKTILDFINEAHDYRRIFGTRSDKTDSVMANIDMIISGLGDIATSENDPWFQETMEMEQLTNLQKIAAGNIGGVWIARNESNKSECDRVEQINRRWLGIQRGHFVDCANRARNTDAPGVVVVAIESQKATIVLRAIGMVSHLIISQPLARALLKMS